MSRCVLFVQSIVAHLRRDVVLRGIGFADECLLVLLSLTTFMIHCASHTGDSETGMSFTFQYESATTVFRITTMKFLISMLQCSSW